jgi:plasmid stability protein
VGHTFQVSRSLRIAGLSEDVIATLRLRAEARGLSLSAYARELLIREARTPTLEEVLLGEPRIRADVTTEEIVRMIREDRESH